MIGHTGGAAGALAAIACLLTLNKGIIPPTINFRNPDPECDLNNVPNQSIKKYVNIAFNDAFAFGGNNTVIVLKKYNKEGAGV
jgi:3-oxoacyl-[acyl-carrier-protein] synthase II